MTKTILTLALGLLVSATAISQTYITHVKPMGKKEWGFINTKGEWVIEAKYAAVKDMILVK